MMVIGTCAHEYHNKKVDCLWKKKHKLKIEDGMGYDFNIFLLLSFLYKYKVQLEHRARWDES